MSSTNYSNPDRPRGTCCVGGGHWSGANIAAMVLGFIVFPPLGFVVLVWTIMGRPIQELPGWLREKWEQVFRGGKARTYSASDNVVFDEYQQTQRDRIAEIRKEIRSRAEAFRAYRSDAKRRKDEQEFKDFMARNPEKGQQEI